MTVPFAQIISLGVGTASNVVQSVTNFRDTKEAIAQERKNIRREKDEMAVLATERSRMRAEQFRELTASISVVAAAGNVGGPAVLQAQQEVGRDISLNEEFDFRALGQQLQTLTERQQGLDKAEKRAKVNLGLSIATSLLGAGAQGAQVGQTALADVSVANRVRESLDQQYNEMVAAGMGADRARDIVERAAKGQGIQWRAQ